MQRPESLGGFPFRTLLRWILWMAAAAATVSQGNAATFDVYLENFTDNPETADIAYILMYVELQGPIIVVDACTIAGAAAGWWAGNGMCSRDGPNVILEAYDHWGGNALLDGRLFTITSNAPGIGINRIYFWNEGEVGPGYPNLYPGPVQLTDLTSTSATFSAASTAVASGRWGRIKSLYR